MGRVPRVIYSVDDDESFLKVLLRLLRASGLQTLGFGSGGEMADSLPLPKNVCLIIDIFLGRENGLDLPQELYDRGEAPPVVFVSATEDSALLARAVHVLTVGPQARVCPHVRTD